MQTNRAVSFLPIFSDKKKVEVALKDDQAVIKLSTWVEDLGWCGQKTMSLDAEMLDELHRVLSAARLKLKREQVENQGEIDTSNILHFPSFS
ncbi:MAG TPA: hypothetical protein PKE69_13530 [Pyrinomonadaceae bacterium]|nr:hypothetical protein [Pyrinomonadaceae bacterium]